jgi:hypothetical protein
MIDSAQLLLLLLHMLQVRYKGPVRDVWLQLLKRCAAEPDCHPSALLTLVQLAQHRSLAVQRQQQLP